MYYDVQWGIQVLWLITCFFMFIFALIGDINFLFSILEWKRKDMNVKIHNNSDNIADNIKDIIYE